MSEYFAFVRRHSIVATACLAPPLSYGTVLGISRDRAGYCIEQHRSVHRFRQEVDLPSAREQSWRRRR
jgi:hypothetical protein